jgi:cobalt-zinc-cadmium efflux system protein
MSRVSRLIVVLALNVLLVAGLVVVGFAAHSLGVLAAGADYLADAAAIVGSLFAIWLSTRPTTARRPQGYPKATALAALINGGWLLVLSVFVSAAAIDRLATRTPHLDGLPVLIASGVASITMVVGVAILGGDVDPRPGHGDGEGDALNVRAVLLDTAADAAAAGGVALTGGIILASGGFYWLDPTVALIIALVIGYHTLALLKDVMRTLKRPDGTTDSRLVSGTSG